MSELLASPTFHIAKDAVIPVSVQLCIFKWDCKGNIGTELESKFESQL